MPQITSGQVLREARERKGYDVATVAHRLRIRNDILRAIEANDFSSMPSRGYTRNMINAYAQLLGLNATEIVNMYLDEAYAYQVERERNKAQSIGFARGGTSLGTQVRRRTVDTNRYDAPVDDIDEFYDLPDYESSRRNGAATSRSRSVRSARNTTRNGRTTNRRLYDDRTMYSRDDYGIARGREDESRSTSRDYLSNHTSYVERKRRSVSRSAEESALLSSSATNSRRSSQRSVSPRQQRQHRILSERRRNNQIYAGQTPMSYTAPRAGSGLIAHLPLVLIIVVIVVVVVLLLLFFMRHADNSGASDVSTLPVSGISDTTGTADDPQEEDLTVEIAPTSARIVYAVPEGKQAYLEIYVDGNEQAQPEMITGPFEKTVETTGTWTISTYVPDNVEVTVNGERVTLQADQNYGGMSVYTVDFPAILEEWKRTHTSARSQRSAALADAANAASADAQQAQAQAQAQSAASSQETATASTDSTNSAGTTSATSAASTTSRSDSDSTG